MKRIKKRRQTPANKPTADHIEPSADGDALSTNPQLRHRAMAAMQQAGLGRTSAYRRLPGDDPQKLLQELRVHQMELEMQNEHLRRFQAEVEAWHAKYFALYDLAPVGYCTLSNTGLILQANMTATQMLGVTRSELIRKPLSRFVLKKDADSFQLLRRRLHSTKGSQSCELRMVKSDGTPLWVHLSAAAMPGEGASEVLHIALTDISASVSAEELKKALDKDQSVISAIADLIFVNQRDGTYLEVKASDPRLLFAPPEALLGRKVQDVFPDPMGRLLMDAFARALDTKMAQDVDLCLSLEGRDRCFEARIAPTAQNKVITIMHDITERKNTEESLRHLAHYDLLTQLPNRRFLYDRLEQAMAGCKRRRSFGALMFLDLDNFKPLNDTQGHDVGDLLLMEVARRLKACVREIDTVGRYGGDEFGVILGDLDADLDAAITQARLVAEKICHCLAEPYILTFTHDQETPKTVQHHCTASIGIALFGLSVSNPQDIVRDADLAMYQAKAAGGNRVHCYGLSQ